jgi:hypothetical protein
MTNSPIKPSLIQPSSKSRRPVFGAVLLVAFVLAVLASSALAAGKLLRNGSFEKDTNGDGRPNKWSISGAGTLPTRDCTQSHNGACSLKFVLDGQSKTAQQVIPISGSAGDKYTLDFWVTGESVTYGGEVMSLGIFFHHLDGSNNGSAQALYEGTTAWAHWTIAGALSIEDFDYIYILFQADAASGTGWYDKLRVVVTP